MELRPMFTIIPPPDSEQDESLDHHEQQNRHDTLRQLGAATYRLDIVTTEGGSIRNVAVTQHKQRLCCTKNTGRETICPSLPRPGLKTRHS